MPQEKTEGVVLRSVDFSETSRIVTFLSPNRGRLACLVKGARRRNSPTGPLLDTLNRVELVCYWKDGRTVQQLGEVTLIDSYPGVKRDFAKATYAAFPLELAYKTARENEPSEALYAALVLGLEGLDGWPGDAKGHMCWQALRLLTAAGFAPELGHCIDCGRPVDETPGFAWRGGVTCRACPSDRRLSPAGYASLRAMAESGARCPDTAGSEEIFRVLWRYGIRQLETDFRSVRVIDQMIGRSE